MNPTTKSQWWVLGLAAVASFMVVLDLLVVATALTAIQRDLHASMEDLEWTVNAYTLSFAALLMTSASLGDRYGRKRLFMVGLAVFTLGSIACALSPTVGALIAARAVQGVGAATIMPLALGLIGATFPPERRGWALGIYGSVTGLAAVLGPVLGGVIAEGLAWQWVFWLNVPVGLLAIGFVFTRITEGFGRNAAVDVPGVVLFTLAALGLVWGLVRAGAVGWTGGQALGPLAAGAVLTVIFLWWQAKAPAPMLPLRLFGSRSFSAGNVAIFMFNASLTGAIFFMTQFQQVALGQGPLSAGLRMLPWGIVPALLAPRSGTLADRIGERPLIAIGMGLQALGLAWIALITAPDLAYLPLVAPMIVVGAGFALAAPALTKAVVSTSSPADIGKASGAFSTARQLGGAFGVAIIGAVFAATGSYASPAAFSDGFGSAMWMAAALAGVAALAGATLARTTVRVNATAASAPSTSRADIHTSV